jgi:transcriptional regulator with XRE-family HTH domain
MSTKRPAFARRLIRTREERNLSQEEAARQIGVGRVTLARWELGTQEPSGLARRAVEAWLKGE